MNNMGAIMAFISATGIACAAPTAGSATSRAATRARRVGTLMAAAMLLPVALGGAAPVSRLDVALDKLRSTKGMVRVCLTADPANFPACVDDADAVRLSIAASEKSFTLPGLPRGDYALAVVHDENGNGKLDTFAGIPREGYGFSRNAPVRFGPPRFKAARFTVAGDTTSERVTMRYLL